MKYLCKYLVPVLVALSLDAGWVGTANAQTAARPAATLPPEIAPNPASFAAAALNIVRASESGQAAQLWDGGSPILKRLVPRDQFIATARQRAATYGAVQNLGWRSIVRLTVTQPQAQFPAGEYLSVNFVGLSQAKRQVTVTVTFVVDADRTWRLVGINVG